MKIAIVLIIIYVISFTFFAGRWAKNKEYRRHGRNTKGHYWDSLFASIVILIGIAVIILTVIGVITII